MYKNDLRMTRRDIPSERVRMEDGLLSPRPGTQLQCDRKERTDGRGKVSGNHKIKVFNPHFNTTRLLCTKVDKISTFPFRKSGFRFCKKIYMKDGIIKLYTDNIFYERHIFEIIKKTRVSNDRTGSQVHYN